MNSKHFHNVLNQLTCSLESFSIVNQEGQLLFSKDATQTDLLTTTRLVCFQIIKKYLQPKPLDLFIMNDPENGGYSLTKMIFVAALSDNLYVIWNKDLNFIDFKIPPTPLYENNQKNSFVWQALVDSHPQSLALKAFFETEKLKLETLLFQKEHIAHLSAVKNQSHWLKATQEIFDLQFTNKALGSAESFYRLNATQIIKLKLTSEERQNVKLMTLDFTNTSFAVDYSTSSHVVESGLIQKIIQFYQIENFFSQSILDKIKIMLPPKSIVSKAHPKGEWNCEIQSICSQLCAFNLAQMNSQTRKVSSHFELASELKFDLVYSANIYPLRFDFKTVSIEGLENLLVENKIQLLMCQRSEQHIKIKFHVNELTIAHLQIRSKLFTESKDYLFKINDQSDFNRKSPLKANDQVEITWKLS